MTIEEFLKTSYTAYHAVQNGISILRAHGFVPFAPDKDIAQKGGKYYVTLADSTMVAFVTGPQPTVMLAESHTDSPCLKVRGTVASPLGQRIDVEEYGGLLRHSMMDIPCRVAGRIVYQTEGGVGVKIATSDFAVTIPSLCVHFGGAEIAPTVQNDLMPLLGEGDLWQKLCPEGPVLDADVYVVPDIAPYRSGIEGQWLCAPRIDNLTSVYTSLMALAEAKPQGIAVCACFDNEETGSRTRQSAGGALLDNLMHTILAPYGVDHTAACMRGLALSIDNAHSVHPAHPEKSEPNSKVLAGKGIVIKHNPNYATDAMSAGLVKRLLQRADIPYQDFYNHADGRCGGTLGLMPARQLLIPTCDIGIAQLAMHSAVETADYADIDTMQRAVTAFYNTLPIPVAGGGFNLL